MTSKYTDRTALLKADNMTSKYTDRTALLKANSMTSKYTDRTALIKADSMTSKYTDRKTLLKADSMTSKHHADRTLDSLTNKKRDTQSKPNKKQILTEFNVLASYSKTTSFPASPAILHQNFFFLPSSSFTKKGQRRGENV